MKISICQNQPQKDLFVATHTHAHAVKLLTFEVSFVKSKNIPFYDQQLPETRCKIWKYPTELKVKYASSDQTTARKSVWVQVRFFPIQLNAKTAKRKHKTFIVSRKNTEWSNKFQPIVSVGFYFCGRGEYFYNSQTHTHTNISTHGYEKSLTRPSKSIGE